MHNEELHNLYASPNIVTVNKSRRMKWSSHIARMRKMETAYEILGRRPTSRWNIILEWDFREIGLEVVDWIHLAQDRYLYGNELSGSIKGRKSLE